MRQIILDTETTGLDPAQGHRVVELACVEMVNRSLTGRHLHLYLNPDRDSDPEALAVHGLKTDFLSSQPRFHEVAEQLVEYVRGAEVIIHNAAFDVKFLDAELERAGLPRFGSLCETITDSLLYARELHPGKRNSLDALCERYGISNAHRTLHGALLDSELLADVWLAMTRGQDSLLMDIDDKSFAATGSANGGSFDASSLKLLCAGPEEEQAHRAYLEALDKSSGGQCVWRQYETTDVPGKG
ncbi:MAG TPA: DNA polymerase III subunit epsilon [Pusillimonas sp.]|nr:DNA polymerase III subunit epsilon [Pusillimonas sp.]